MTLIFRRKIQLGAKMETFVGCVNVHSETREGIVFLVFGHMGHTKAKCLRDWDLEIEQG